MKNNDRQVTYRKNLDLEERLRELNALLCYAELKALDKFETPEHPVILIVGCARSGSTLLFQWLASLGYFCYPTNLLSRFYQAPFIGAMVQQILMDAQFDFHGELYDLQSHVDWFSSDLGKTKGALAPHEFWYFWRRFFQFGEIQYLDENQLSSVDVDTFLAELAAVESVFRKPLAMKGMIVNWNIQFINSIMPKVLFLYVKRAPLYNAQSLLETRERFFGTVDRWYSFKPPEWHSLKNSDPYTQVAGQVYFTNKAIMDQLQEIDSSRWLTVEYEAFCRDPRNVFVKLIDRFREQGCQLVNGEYQGPASFESGNLLRLSEDACSRIASAYAEFSGCPISW